jgi:ribosomal protein L18
VLTAVAAAAAVAAATAAQVIDDAAGRTLVAASTLTADVKSSVEGNGANIVSSRELAAYRMLIATAVLKQQLQQ